MPMGDIDQMFPRKSRDPLDIEGMTDADKAYFTQLYNSYISAGFSPAEAIAKTNDIIYRAKNELLIAQANEKYAIEKAQTQPRPDRNLSGDVTVRRMTEFLRFMNAFAGELSDEDVLLAIENEWTDVIDYPTTAWDSDVYGLTLYLIGGGLIANNVKDGTWLYLDDSVEKQLNTS